jgi:hypothetical protein
MSVAILINQSDRDRQVNEYECTARLMSALGTNIHEYMYEEHSDEYMYDRTAK